MDCLRVGSRRDEGKERDESDRSVDQKNNKLVSSNSLAGPPVIVM